MENYDYCIETILKLDLDTDAKVKMINAIQDVKFLLDNNLN